MLGLTDTKDTDAGLAHLARLKNLRWLYLSGTHVTDEGVATLAEQLPDTKIVR